MTRHRRGDPVADRSGQPDVEVAPDPAPVRPTDPAELVTRLQRGAGNAAVSRLLETGATWGRGPLAVARNDQDGGTASPVTPTTTPPGPGNPPAPPRVSFVFFMGATAGDTFYRNAERFWRAQLPAARRVAATRRAPLTLAGIIEEVNRVGRPVERIVIVSHANAEGNAGFSLDLEDHQRDRTHDDHKARLTFQELHEALESGRLPSLDPGLVDAQTTVDFRGCAIGRSEAMLDQLDLAFGGETTVAAPTHAQAYRSRRGGVQEGFTGAFFAAPGAPPVRGLNDGLTDAGVGTWADGAPSQEEVVDAFAERYPQADRETWARRLRRVRPKVRRDTASAWDLPDPTDEDAVRGAFGATLDARFPPGEGWEVEFLGVSPQGDRERWAWEATRTRADGGTDTRSQSYVLPARRTRDDLMAEARARIADPEEWRWGWREDSAVIPGAGIRLTRVWLVVERTEWEYGHRTMIESERGVPLTAPTTDPQWYGQSTAGP